MEQKSQSGFPSYTPDQLTSKVIDEDSFMGKKITRAMQLGVSKEQALRFYAYGKNMGREPEKKDAGFFSRVVEDVKKRSANFGESIERFKEGEQGVISTGLQLAGEATGLAFGDVPGRAIQSGIEATPDIIKEPIKQVGIAILKTDAGKAGLDALEQGMESYEAWKSENPVVAENLESVVNIVTALPIGAIMGKAGQGVGQLGKVAVKQIDNIPNPLSIIKNDKAADRLFQSALDLNFNQIRNIARPNVAGKNPVTWMREKGIIGTREQVIPQLEELATGARQAVVQSIDSVPGKFTLKQTDQALDEVLKQVTDANGMPKAGLEELANKAALLRALPEKTLAQHQQTKELMDDVLRMFGKTNEGKDSIMAEGWRNIREKVKTFIEQKADDAGLPDIKRLNKDTQVSTAILKALTDTGGDLGRSKLTTLVKKLGGAGGSALVGGVIGGPGGALIGLALEQIMTNPRSQVFLAKLLGRYADDEIKAVRELLEKGIKSKKATQIMDDVAEDMTELLRLPVEQQRMLFPDVDITPDQGALPQSRSTLSPELPGKTSLDEIIPQQGAKSIDPINPLQ